MESGKEVDGKMIRNIYFNALMLIWCCIINCSNSVPIDYCLHPLNQSNCGLKPTSVFSYYKPGSRCEIETWRGCPTFNKFPDEFLCSHYCIGKLWGKADDIQLDMMVMDVEKGEPIDECFMPMNDNDCGDKEQFKYSFINDTCVKVAWRGCQSYNIFDNEEICVKICYPPTTYDLEQQLEELPIHEMEVIDDILEGAMAENTPRSAPILQLHLPIKIETTVNPTTTARTTTVSAVTTNRPVQITTEITETSSKVEEATSIVKEITSTVGETTSTVGETTSTTEETTSKHVETTEVTKVDTTPAASTTTVITATTTEASGSAEEVILT